MNEILAERKVDILVNCAGVISAKPFDQLTYEEWERTIRINLSGCLQQLAQFSHTLSKTKVDVS